MVDQVPKKSALLVMDIQSFILGRIPDHQNLLKTVATAIEKARKAKLPIIYVVLAFRAGYPEINPNNKIFYGVSQSGAKLSVADETTQIPSEIAPKDEDVIVYKKRFSAFPGTDLEMILRAKGVNHLVLSGISTSGVVLSTLREAGDKDFGLTVLSDCCLDRDQEVHNVMINKVFPMQAEVITAEEWLKSSETK